LAPTKEGFFVPKIKTTAAPVRAAPPSKLHIDKRADAIVEGDAGRDDEMMSTLQVAAWLGMSTQWLEGARFRGFGPKYMNLGPRMVRYRRGDIIEWLRTRTHQSTSEYATPTPARRSSGRPRAQR
jgi:predicted DNA-binding transcriptional regulator AlpA